MDNLSTVFMVIAIVLMIGLVAMSFRGKNKKYRVTTAGTDAEGKNVVMEVERKWYDGWNDPKDMRVYHVGKKTIYIPAHWIILIEEL
jgi:ABC-type cobalt transport system substrate-binding protein